MKNLFKNLMLVAVAAMAFTACTESNNEVDASVEKVVLNFVAEIDNDGDETRSGFVGSTTENDITKYQSAWDGTEKLAIFDMSTNNYLTETTINAEGQFSVEFEVDNKPDYIYVCSPASAWSDPYTCTIPAEQTPLANSVDPAAHILNGYVSTTGSELSMQHQVAYGKMTLKDVDFEIARVELNLKGVKFGWDSKDITYTLHNNGSVVDNVFWFTTEPSFEISEFTVTAFDAEGNNAVTKTVDVVAAGKTLSFGYGQVSKFSVSGLEEYVAPDTVMDSAKYYYDYNNYGGYNNWGYVVFEDEFLGTLVLNCTFANGLYLDICTYTSIANTLGVRFDPDYSFYNVVGGNIYSLEDYWYYDSKMTVDVVDGKYSITLDIKNTNGEILKATYVGDIEGLGYPDLRTQLEMPNVTANVEGNIITLSWDRVEGAESYLVSCEVGGLEAISTSETSVSIEADYLKNYTFKVQAVASDSDPDFKSSNYCYVEVTTERDPNQVIPEFTTMTYVGTEDTYLEYGEYCHVFELTSSDNYKMNLYVGSYQASSTHIDVGEYHYEGKMNLGYANAQWGFQAKVWNSDGSYLGLTAQNSEMVVKKSGDIYNIDFTLIIDGNTHFFVCNAAIGGNEPAPEPEPEVYTDFAETAEMTVVFGQTRYVSETYTLANGTWIETANDYNYGSYTTTQEGNVYKFSFTDEKNKRNVVITYTEETGGDTPADVTLTFTKDLTSEYGSGYEDYCYYELTSGADVIGFWIFNNKSDKHDLYDGTYTNGTSINHVAYYPSSGVFIEDITIDGQYISRTNNRGAQASSSIVISNQGGHVVINLDYVDGGAEVKSRTYEFNGTIN